MDCNNGKNKKSKISRSFNRFKANPIRNFDGNTFSIHQMTSE